jgi:hypothetical protein
MLSWLARSLIIQSHIKSTLATINNVLFRMHQTHFMLSAIGASTVVFHGYKTVGT